MKAKNVVPMGISLPIELKTQIDEERGDIGLSRYILRILESHYGHRYPTVATAAKTAAATSKNDTVLLKEKQK
jgi:hypothetical protein